MQIDLQHVAKTARLDLTKEEEERLRPQIEEILDIFGILDEIDVEGADPAFHPVERSLSKEDALGNTTLKEEDYFKGPRIL